MMFSYFEVLVALSSSEPSILKQERERVDGLTKMLHRSNYTPIVWEQWVEETMELFDRLIKDLPERSSLDDLHKTFNDEELAPAIVQHFRVRHVYFDHGQTQY